MTYVFRIRSVYNASGSLVVAPSVADAVQLWCARTNSYENSITSVEPLGSAYVVGS